MKATYILLFINLSFVYVSLTSFFFFLFFLRFLNAKPKVEIGGRVLSRVGFIEKTSGVEVFALKPLNTSESHLLSRVSSYIPFIKLYTNRYLAAKNEEEFPIDMCEQLVNSLIDLVDDLGKGDPAPRRFENVADYCTEANSLNESAFAQLFGNCNPTCIPLSCFMIPFLQTN